MNIIEVNGNKYQLIEEEFEKGDYVVCKDYYHSHYSITDLNMYLGKVTEVYRGDSPDIAVKVISHKKKSYESHYNLGVDSKHFRKATLREIEKHYEGNPEHKLKVGDYVVFNGEKGTYSKTNEKMLLGKVSEVDIETAYQWDTKFDIVSHEDEELEGYENLLASSKHFRKATSEEIEEHKEGNPEHKCKLKVGDYVVDKETDYVDEKETGDIMVVAHVETMSNKPLTVYKVGKTRSYTRSYDEVDKVGISQRELSFIRAGRKKGEIREGDLYLYCGDLYESEMDTFCDLSRIVCPVEKRTDLPGLGELE